MTSPPPKRARSATNDDAETDTATTQPPATEPAATPPPPPAAAVTADESSTADERAAEPADESAADDVAAEPATTAEPAATPPRPPAAAEPRTQVFAVGCPNPLCDAEFELTLPEGEAHLECGVCNTQFGMRITIRSAAETATATARPPPFQRQRPLRGKLRSVKVRMILRAGQVQELKRIFAVRRLAYNATVERVKNGAYPNFIAMRDARRADVTPEWARGVHHCITEGGVGQACNAFQSNFAIRRKNPNHYFVVRFCSTRHTPTESIKVPRARRAGDSFLNEFKEMEGEIVEGVSPRRRVRCIARFGMGLGDIVLEDKPRIVAKMLAEGNQLKEDARIVWDKRRRSFHLVYTFDQPNLADPDPEFKKKKVVSTDPGIKAFAAFTSVTTGEHGELLTTFGDDALKRARRLDEMQSRLAQRKLKKCPSDDPRKKRKWYRTTRALVKQLARERRRVHGWVEAAHYDAANFLLNRYDILILPKLRVSELVARAGRNIRPTTARAMQLMSHYAFRQRVKSAAARYAGKFVIEPGEPGTSKTCTFCGLWKACLKLTDRVFICVDCTVACDRDVSAARNNGLAAAGAALGIGWDGKSG